MNVRIFGNSAATAAPRELRPARAEPRLFPGGESRSLAAAAVDGPRLAVAESEPGTSTTSPLVIRAPGDRLVSSAGGAGAGAALQVALVGVVAAAIIGAFLGAGFLLFPRPAEQTVVASQPGSASAAAPTALATAAPHPAAAALPAVSAADRALSNQAAPVSQIPPAKVIPPSPPASPIGKSPSHAAALATGPNPPIPAVVTATKTAAPEGRRAAIFDHRAHPRPAANSDQRSHRPQVALSDRRAQPPPRAASDHRADRSPATASDHQARRRPPAALSDRGMQPPPAATSDHRVDRSLAAASDHRAEHSSAAASDHRAQRPAAAASNHVASRPTVHDRPDDRTRTARRPQLRPPGDGRPAKPRPARAAQLSAPSQDGGTQSFDQLLSQLTQGAQHQAPKEMQPRQRPRSAEQVLTPPAADQPDPFAAGGPQR